MPLVRFIEPDEYHRIQLETEDRKQGISNQYETQMKRKDGEVRTIIVSASPLTNKDGDFKGTQAIITDITERVKTEAQLKLQSLALESAANAIVITDGEGSIQWANPAFSILTGYALDDVIGNNPRILKSDQHNDKYYKDLWDTISAGKVWKGEIINKRVDGELYTEEMTIAPLVNEKNEIRNYIAIKQDISDRVRAMEEIQQRTEDLALINAINNAANQGMNLSEIIKLLSKEAKKLFSSKSTALYLYNQDDNCLVVQTLTVPPEIVKRIENLIGIRLPEIRIPVEDGSYTQELLNAQEPKLINDSETILKWMLEFTKTSNLSEKLRPVIRKLISQIFKLVNIQSVITVPLISAGEVIGLMDFSRVEPFTWEEATRAANVVGQLTAAITSLRAKEENTRSRNLLLSLSQAAPVIQQANNSDEIFHAIGEEVKKIGLDVTVFILQDDKKKLAVTYHSLSDLARKIEKLTGLSSVNYSFPLKPGGFFHKIITKEKAMFSHLEIEPIAETLPKFVQPLAGKIMEMFGKHQSIIAPLAIGGKVYGLISISGPGLTMSDMPAVTTFANQAAIALEKTRLSHETEVLGAFNESIVQNMSEGIVLEDIDGFITFVNPSALKMLGYTAEEWVGKHWTDIVPNDQQSITQDANERRMRGKSDRYELELVNNVGQRMSVIVSGSPRLDQEGQFTGTIAVFTDITERVQAEKKQRESEQRFRSIFEGVNDAIFVESLSGEILDVNSRTCEMFGWSRDEMLTKSVYDLVPEGQLSVIPGDLPDEIPQSQTIETINLRSSGEPFPVEITTRVQIIAGESVQLVVVRDITERKQADKKISRFNRIFEDSINEIFIFDPDTLKFIQVNAAGQNNLGYTMEELYDLTPMDITPEISVDSFEYLIAPLRKNETDNLVIETYHQRKDGSQYNVEVHLQLLRYEDDILFVAIILDVTDRYNAEIARNHYIRRLDALLNIDQAIMGSFDLQVTLNVILEHLCTQLSVDAAAVLSYQADLQTLTFTQSRGFLTTALQTIDLRLGEGYAGEVGLRRDHVFVPDLNLEISTFKDSSRFSQEGFVSYYGVPLITKGKLVGVLEIYHRSPLDPDYEWVNYLKLLAGQIAIAIDNISLFDDLQRTNVDLTLAYDATIEGWAHALELKDMETEGHSRRVVKMTMDLARIMGISGEKLAHVRRGALMHDIGKMGIPDSILLKSGKLSDDEWEIMRQHPVYALNWLSRIQYLEPALEIPYSHHERWDGTGYPRGIKGEQIPLAARIFAVVDVWDALTADRPYRKAWSNKKALDHIQKESGKHFDPQVVEVFLKQISKQG